MSSPVLLQARSVTHRYGSSETLRGFDLSLRVGEIGCLLGPSGCGKTTALRCIAGFERVGGGEIRLRDRVVASPTVHVAPEKRRVGLMFQDLALFPHCTVAENIGFGLHGLSALERRKRVEFLLSVTHLSECRDRHPHELSGGQQQRVALARALAPEPELILLDEPFSNLDPELRERLKREVRRILKECHATALLVTHDQDEAFDVADRIAVMNAGRVDQFGPAYEIYHEPRTRFVANFIGRGLFVPGVVKGSGEIQTELGSLRGALPAGLRGDGAAVDVFLRPDDLIHDDSSPLSAEVVEKTFRGLYHLYLLRTEAGRLVQCLAPSHHDHPIGSRIGVRLEIDHLVVFAQLGVTPPLAVAEHTSGS